MALNRYADVMGLASDLSRPSTSVLQLVLLRFTAARDFRRPIDVKNDELYRLYRVWQEEGHFAWEHNIVVPKAFEVVESLCPQIIDALYEDSEFISVVGQGVEDEPFARNVQEVIQNQIRFDMRVQEKSIPFTKNCAIFGYSAFKLTWEFVQRNKEVLKGYTVDPNTNVIVPIRQIEPVTVHDGPKLEVIDPYDLYLDPKARSSRPEDMHYIIHRTLIPRNDLYSLERQGIFHDVDKITAGPTSDVENVYARRYSYDDLTSPYTSTRDKVDLVEVIEYWGKLPAYMVYDNPEDYVEYPDEEVESVAAIVNRRHVVRAEPTPFNHGKKPFIVTTWWQNTTHPYGISLLEPVSRLCEQLSDSHNQYADNKESSSNNMWKIRETANIDTSLLVTRPNGVIPVQTMEDVESVPIADNTRGLVDYMAILEQQIDKTTGTTESFLGFNTGPATETASRSYIKKQAGDIRIKYVIFNMQMSVVRPMAEMVFELNAQFPRPQYVVRILGARAEEWPIYTPDNLWTYKFDFIPQSKIAAYGSKSVLIQQYMTYLNIAINHPNSVPEELLRLGAKLLLPKYADRLVRSDNTIESIAIGEAQKETLMYRKMGIPYNFKPEQRHDLHLIIHSHNGIMDNVELAHVGQHYSALNETRATRPTTPLSSMPGYRTERESQAGSPDMESSADTMRQVQVG